MEILTADQMRGADKKTLAKIMPESALVENAGFAAACQITKNYSKRPVIVLCGTGNNGADGFVVAKLLQNRGWPVEVALFGDAQKMSPAAAEKSKKFKGVICPPSFKKLARLEKRNGLIVDAVFGTGLNRPVENDIAEFFNAVNESRLARVALDIPSGIDADTGAVVGTAVRCDMTITFCRPKIGHYLYPGKEYTGELIVCPIGIPDDIVQLQNPLFYENTPELFDIPSTTPYSHKYSRGTVLIRSGEMTGAARLTTAATRRAGAGWVAVSCSSDKRSVFENDLPATVIETADTPEDFERQINASKISVAVIGMGLLPSDTAKAYVHAVAKSGKPFVADAGALPYIRGCKDLSRAVITPHLGEFLRLFPELQGQSKLVQTLSAAKALNCTVVLKGADTVIASAIGTAAINSVASFDLATAGSGDVLNGTIAAMLSKGLPPFEAACAGVWLHSRAGENAGPNMIAEDLINCLK